MPLKRCFAAAACAAALGQAVAALGQSAPGTTFRDCPNCPEMVTIPAGRFVMGAAPGEEEREGVPKEYRGLSEPRIALQIGRFALGRYEVTRSEFAAFVAETGHKLGGGCYATDEQEKWALNARLDWRNPGFAQTDRHPVVCVSWNDAVAYVAWLGRKTGKNYRLPSEAEWEYAARAGSQTARPWGNAASDACAYANVWDFSAKKKYAQATKVIPCTDGFVHTAPVGSFAANAFGLHDMIGNVWEWVQDCWNETLAGMPVDGAARQAGDCRRRVGRGGSWESGPGIARTAFRYKDIPGLREHQLGFRVARGLPEVAILFPAPADYAKRPWSLGADDAP